MMETYDAGLKVRSTPRHAGNVKRYHAWPTLQTQTNADHTYHVIRIYIELFGVPEPNVLQYMVMHDLGEVTSGDTPFPAKLTVPGLKEAVLGGEQQGMELLGYDWPDMSPIEFWWVKICDLLEMYEFACVEVRMGNSYAQAIKDNITHYLAIHLAKERFSSLRYTDAVQRYIEERIY